MAKKYYWLKLKRDFFKRHDIRIIEEMPNGKDYILLYLKLLVESIDHEGNLRFSNTIPYNDKMIATITHTNIDIVRSAMKVFNELKFIEILDDETIYMAQVDDMIGSETEWAKKKRLYRESQIELGQSGGQEKTLSDKSKSIEKELEKENIKEEIEIFEFTEKQQKLINSLCATFGINEINQFQNYSLIVNMVKLQITNGNYDWFRDQVWYYFQYKKLTKEKVHGFKSFIGDLTDPEKGGWNSDNWKKKFEEEKKKKNIEPKSNVQPSRTKRLGISSTLKDINNLKNG